MVRVATDIDQDALEIATKNFINSSKQSNLKFYCGHWWTPFESFKGKLDLVISNPPYIPNDTYEKLQEVKNFEPKIALLGGKDGLKHIEIIEKAPLYLRKAWLIMENHFDQGEKVRQLLIKMNLNQLKLSMIFQVLVDLPLEDINKLLLIISLNDSNKLQISFEYT